MVDRVCIKAIELTMETSSDGLIALLERKGIKPTGNSEKDLELAKSVMSEPRKKESKK